MKIYDVSYGTSVKWLITLSTNPHIYFSSKRKVYNYLKKHNFKEIHDDNNVYAKDYYWSEDPYNFAYVFEREVL